MNFLILFSLASSDLGSYVISFEYRPVVQDDLDWWSIIFLVLIQNCIEKVVTIHPIWDEIIGRLHISMFLGVDGWLWIGLLDKRRGWGKVVSLVTEIIPKIDLAWLGLAWHGSIEKDNTWTSSYPPTHPVVINYFKVVIGRPKRSYNQSPTRPLLLSYNFLGMDFLQQIYFWLTLLKNRLESNLV